MVSLQYNFLLPTKSHSNYNSILYANDNLKFKLKINELFSLGYTLDTVFLLPIIFTHLLISKSIGNSEGFEKVSILGGFLPLSPWELLYFL